MKSFRMIETEVKDQIKMDINYWLKENFPGCIIPRKSLKDIVRMIKHEIIHYKISLKFIGDIRATIKITFFVANPGFGYNAKCLTRYPLIYNLPQYYPKYIFIEFVQYLFDIIWSIFSLGIFKNFRSYTTNFLKTLFHLKLQKGDK